jgi:hypothetical protein
MVMEFFPAMDIVAGVARAFIASSLTCHLPSAPAVVFRVCPAKVTVTTSPALAPPQTGTGMSRCRTMWSAKIVAGTTSARTCQGRQMHRAETSGRMAR